MAIRTAFITGASAGIGKACATLLAKNNYRLIISGRRSERLEQLAAELRSAFKAEVYPLAFDIRNENEVKTALQSLPEEWKSIDVLINNAGLASGLASIEEGEIWRWDTMIDTNVKGLLYITRHLLPTLIKQQNPHIINISSIAGKEVYNLGNVYCATKHAVDALTRSMRLDLSKYPVKVSMVCPGAVETEFSEVRFDGDKERAKKVYDGFDNLLAEDIADAVYYILSRPPHVNINDMVVMPTAQPMAGVIHRK